MKKQKSLTIEKQAYRLNEFVHAYGVGRTTIYEEIKKGRLEVIKIGRRTIITKSAADKWLSSYE